MHLKQNLYKYEKHIRGFVGVILLVGAVYYSSWWLAVFSISTLLTSSYEYCPIHDALGLNNEGARRNHYLSQFPIYNPEPTILVRKDGQIDFKNQVATELLEGVERIDEFFPKDMALSTLIDEGLSIFNQVQIGDGHYMVHFKGIPEIDSMLAFGFNITDLVNINEEMITTQKDIVYKMGEIGETRSKETGNHVKRVAEYSYILANAAGLSQNEADTLKIVSPMHDIGKVGIPDAILNKPGKLNGEEWEIMKTHAEIGYEMLKNSNRPILRSAAIVANEHHERWDGEGYPNGLKGNDIHIYGRITAIADVFDALGSERVYKKAWQLDKILALFKEESGKHFDPTLVELMLLNLDKFLEIRDKYKDS